MKEVFEIQLHKDEVEYIGDGGELGFRNKKFPNLTVWIKMI